MALCLCTDRLLSLSGAPSSPQTRKGRYYRLIPTTEFPRFLGMNSTLIIDIFLRVVSDNARIVPIHATRLSLARADMLPMR